MVLAAVSAWAAPILVVLASGPLAVPAWGTWPALAEWVPMAAAPSIVVVDMLAAMPFMAVADMRIRYGRGYGYRRYGGYWPWLGVGVAGLAVAAASPYYGGYGYSDDCVQWRPDYGWVNVCNYPAPTAATGYY